MGGDASRYELPDLTEEPSRCADSAQLRRRGERKVKRRTQNRGKNRHPETRVDRRRGSLGKNTHTGMLYPKKEGTTKQGPEGGKKIYYRSLHD